MVFKPNQRDCFILKLFFHSFDFGLKQLFEGIHLMTDHNLITFLVESLLPCLI